MDKPLQQPKYDIGLDVYVVRSIEGSLVCFKAKILHYLVHETGIVYGISDNPAQANVYYVPDVAASLYISESEIFEDTEEALAFILDKARSLETSIERNNRFEKEQLADSRFETNKMMREIYGIPAHKMKEIFKRIAKEHGSKPKHEEEEDKAEDQ